MTATKTQNVKPFDFRKPCRLPLSVEKRITTWQQRACRLLPQKWTSLFSGETNWTVTSPETLATTDATLPPHMVVVQVAIEGVAAKTLLGIPAELAVAIVQAILGQTDEIGEPRSLTSVELSVLELALGATVEAIAESGSGAGYPHCTLGEMERRALLIRLYPSEPELVFLRFRVKCIFGEGNIDWVWPASLADELFSQPEHDAAIMAASPKLDDVAMRIPLELRVELGAVQLHVADLSTMQIGDVLVFDQRISEPLTCFVEDQEMLHAYPGVTGTKQSIRIV